MLQNQVQDHDQLVFWMTAKRLFFFAATGLLLYLYLVRQFRRKAQAYDELHGSEQRLNRALEAVRDGLWDWDLVTDRMFVSPGYAALIGLAPEELGDPIETWKKRLHPEEYATVLEAHRNHLQGLTDNLDHIYRLRHKDGDYRWIHSRGRVLRDALGKPLHYTGVARDITLQRLKEDHLRQAAAVFDSTREGVLVTDAQAVIVHVNPSFERITGYRSEDVLGKTPAILRSGRQDQAFYQRLWLALREQDVWSGEIWNRRKSGEIYPQWLHIRAVRNDQGQLTHYVGVFSDLSSIKRSENELDFLAHHDSLTGLPNRAAARAHRAGAGERQGPDGGRGPAADRPRPLQAHQRQPRSHHRRHAPQGSQQAPATPARRALPAVATGRRRIRHPRRERRPGSRRATLTAHPRRFQRAVRHPLPADLYQRQPRCQPLPGRRQRRRPPDATRRRRAVPGQGQRA